MLRKLLWVALGVACLFLAWIVVAPPVAATYYYRHEEWATNNRGRAVEGATVEVWTANTTTPVTIYSDLAGATQKDNPVTTDSDGRYFFYVDAGLYDMNIVHSAWSIDDTLYNVRVGLIDTCQVTRIEATTGAITTGTVTTLDGTQATFTRLILEKLAGALPDTATVQGYGEGAAFWRCADAEPAGTGTLFIWDNGDTLFHYWTSAGTKAAP